MCDQPWPTMTNHDQTLYKYNQITNYKMCKKCVFWKSCAFVPLTELYPSQWDHFCSLSSSISQICGSDWMFPFQVIYMNPSSFALTNAVVVREAFSWHAVAPQALMHVVAWLPILHPVIGCCGNDQENVPHACTKQPSTHKAVHPAPADTHAHTRNHTNRGT